MKAAQPKIHRTAGKGILHSEQNPSGKEAVHLLQIWIQPDRLGIPPSYEEQHFTPESKQGQLRLIASSDGRDGSVLVHQDAAIYAAIPAAGERLTHALAPGRLGYVHVIRGQVSVNGIALKGGDALKITAEPLVTLDQAEAAELLLFDLPV